MSVRQYIGARYVPRFLGTWNNTTQYEALDVVDNGSGTSYIARKNVPAGTPLSDADFWFVYGASSGAIIDLQTRMTTAENDITELQKLGDDDIYSRLSGKKIIVLGDSLTEGSGSALGHTWVENLANDYNANVINEGLSGSPIGGSDPDSFYIRIDSILAANPTCDIFVISGGANDKNRNIAPGSTNTTSSNTTSGALKAIIQKVRTKYKDSCKILCMTTYHRYDDYNTLGYQEYDYVQAVLNACAIVGVPCFNNYNNSGVYLIDDTSNGWMDVGYVDSGVRNYHLSAAAYEYLTPLYAAYLATGIANNAATTPNYGSSGNNNYYRRTFPDGFGESIFYNKNASFTITDLGNHLAIISAQLCVIPAEYAVRFITALNATIIINGWSVNAAITGYSVNADHSINVNVGGSIHYGSTPPSASETGEVLIDIKGISLS